MPLGSVYCDGSPPPSVWKWKSVPIKIPESVTVSGPDTRACHIIYSDTAGLLLRPGLYARLRGPLTPTPLCLILTPPWRTSWYLCRLSTLTPLSLVRLSCSCLSLFNTPILHVFSSSLYIYRITYKLTY